MEGLKNADAAWGTRNLMTGIWTGCPGTERISHEAARFAESAQPGLYRAERNPADVMAEELALMPTEKIMARLAG